MSNSFRKNWITGNTTCESEKQDKRIANRKLRRLVKTKMQSNNFNLPQLREVSNIWHFGKDGKQFLKIKDEKYLRK
ncbi:MAG: hypothetical protein JXA16_13020 [Bacteroidales bacterium]|nr:hypothetical protein [Bacteroidales bacterium]